VVAVAFVHLGLRNDDTGNALPFEPMLGQQHTLVDTLRRYQTIALIALGGVFVGTVISSVASHFSKKRRAEAQAKGYF